MSRVIRLEGIAKSFRGVAALRGVSLAVDAGSVHGLLGENGAGKTTLMRVLFGLERPDAGAIEIDGKRVDIASPRAARRLGLGMVHQHFALVPTLSVLDNLALALQAGLAVVPRARLRAELKRIAASLGWRIDADARVSELAVGEQQRVEIAKALLAGGRALILDEPTAPLTPSEAEELFVAVRRLAAGGAAVVFISHKLAEVEAVCDRITILRRGEVAHAGPLSGLSRERIAELMVGAAPPAAARGAARAPGEDLLVARGLRIAGRGAVPAVREASFAVRSGEIVGIAGVDGNGQAELVRAILGLLRPSAGELVVDGAALHRGERAPLDRLGVIPEDRRRDGLALGLPLTANLLLKDRRQPPHTTRGWLHPSRWRARAAALVAAYDVRCASLGQPAASLSGGNQQKLIAARELSRSPRLVVAANPTRGLDLGATAAVMRRLVAARDAGAGVLLVHGDLDELLAIADRVLVMSGGHLVDSGWPDATRETIGRRMLGGGADA
jgi:simple sugar transport system ATP-binding protein